MNVTLVGIMTATFVFLLLIVLLQNQITPPPPPPPPPPAQATLAAVSAEATRAANEATHTATDRQMRATTQAIQRDMSLLQTRTAGGNDSPPIASPVP